MFSCEKCQQCGIQFGLSDEEQAAYAKFDALLPENCPDCRNKRHLTFRNERRIFRNVSCKSGKQIVSTYPQGSPFKILDQDEWWSDEFDATIYGRDFDFNKPFFEQFKGLQAQVPRWARMFVNCENSEYTNNSASLKNSYLTFSSYDSDALYYCMRVMSSNNCVDCLNVRNSEFCSGCVECKKCYDVHFSQMCEGCNDSFYLYDCKNCSDCILSAQIRNKKYMIFNKQYTKEEYGRFKGDFFRKLYEDKEFILKSFEKLKRSILHRDLRIINSENSTGDFINDSNRVINGFYASECADCVNVYDCSKLKNCYDNLANEKSELALECDTAYELYNAKFCTYTVTASDVLYLDQCISVKKCFGCVGLKQKKYAILNKQYSKEEYEKMLEKINEHMRRTGEYGRPFPSTLSSYPYNLSVAQSSYPLTKERALAQGYMWYDEEDFVADGESYTAPANIEEVDASVCDKVLTCAATGKKFKVILQEFEFYKKFKLPLPRVCPEERYRELCALQPPKKLVDAACSVCGGAIKTVYPSEIGYKVVCEKCYLKTVY